MLKGSLYSVISMNHSDGNIVADLALNANNVIFKGHFPSQPVLPGACMLQMLKEVLGDALNKKLRLKKADQMKFLLPVDPYRSGELKLSIAYSFAENIYVVTATMNIAEGVCFKFKGSFMIIA
jgi:3-hydroxyacyl-[acyl-carrier-protein] dehydratase